MRLAGMNMASVALITISCLAPFTRAVWTCPSEREAYCCTHYEDKTPKGLFGTGCTLAPRKEGCKDKSPVECCKPLADQTTHFCDSRAKGYMFVNQKEDHRKA
ncbi:hypothetical protein H112_00459 [Trichophyton rubrum D6]|uniref:Uncharacterized protein n=3 Tax=Trichophyton TaxID=5550 RepID=F2SZT5_TRIRC|nr:uncharacterized protein TERG_08074 [Trichophyton rubrum CBS 118892]EZF27533.1 hypothetical protein H100_00458 [Trichophyton rubrum MR850]EZF46579.1 hypothetical protein H102_00458 [Trichophyton rubrum CBS 100081]EZF57222.1 hypothetical protein H103_00458 [Trichophyton rubrum CBS 288.86]EZF67827.1 hypothetical protein H104_00448 [Trichophyton rubrum CBS 289.86]EZF78531.1 hypothetical protein H105_00447 [Trichophyton soudanense CBS 452.61]EZF89168.1 hypothetical protein H110_00462 [Trichophy